MYFSTLLSFNLTGSSNKIKLNVYKGNKSCLRQEERIFITADAENTNNLLTKRIDILKSPIEQYQRQQREELIITT
jgi:hypothetical protein